MLKFSDHLPMHVFFEVQKELEFLILFKFGITEKVLLDAEMQF